MAYSPTDFYGALRVNPDHSATIYQGLSSMGSGLASGINSLTNAFVETKREDKRMAHADSMMDKQINAQRAGQDDRQGFEEMMFGKREASDAARRKDDKAMQEAEVAKFGDNKLAAAFHFAESIAPGSFNQQTIDVLKGIEDPKVKAAFADQVINVSADKMRQAQEQEQAIAKAQQARQTHVITDPISGKPDENFYMTGNGMTLPRQTKAATPTAEQLQSLGMVPETATIGGVKFKVPETPKDESEWATDADGKIIKIPPGREIPAGLKPLPKKQTGPDGKPLKTSGTNLF